MIEGIAEFLKKEANSITEALKEGDEISAKETPLNGMLDTIENSSLDSLKMQNKIEHDTIITQVST